MADSPANSPSLPPNPTPPKDVIIASGSVPGSGPSPTNPSNPGIPAPLDQPVTYDKAIDELFSSVPCDDNSSYQMAHLNESAASLAKLIFKFAPPCADRSTALRSLREAIMWANHAISHQGKGL